MVVLVGRSEEFESGACSAFPVGALSKKFCAFVPSNADRGCYLEFHGETPWRESLSALFGERMARCPILTMEYLSISLGTVIASRLYL